MMDKTSKKVLFIGAKTFSGTGGIEQVNKSWIYSLSQLPINLKSLVLADDQPDLAYTQHSFFRGYGGNKVKFLWAYFRCALSSDVLIISHIQIAILIPLLKWLKPKLKTVLICHGIEVWGELNLLQTQALNKTDQILAVSGYTKNKLIDLHNIVEDKVQVFQNALDPFFNVPKELEKSTALMERYHIRPEHTVLLTIARLSSAEQYKGYDFVIEALKDLLTDFPHVKYIIGGKADDAEHKRLAQLISDHGLAQQVLLPGFIAAHEMAAHYQLADVFVMPSTGEGFGISFIEAAACGTPVLGGNSDGSTEAVIPGVTGELCTPKKPLEISKYLSKILKAYKNPAIIQENTLKNYSFEVYHQRIINLLAKLNVIF